MLQSLKLLTLRGVFVAWRLVPGRYRIQAYKWACRHYSRFYRTQLSPKVQRIPYGFYIKCSRIGPIEASSLAALNRYDPTLPIPFLLDIVEEEVPGKTWKRSYIVNTTIVGGLLRDVIQDWDDARRDSFAKELRAVMDRVRALPRPALCTNAVCAIDNGPLFSDRISDWLRVGPWLTASAFHDHLISITRGDHSHVRTDPEILQFHKTFDENRICFTHGDLGPHNILQVNGHLVGIIDWECAGFYPDYWEYSKALWPYSAPTAQGAYDKLIRVVFPEYEAEEKLERRLGMASFD